MEGLSGIDWRYIYAKILEAQKQELESIDTQKIRGSGAALEGY